ncbi:hypothetical protein SERLA73DRAFT_75821 [Serpula lacrymans var. lacrymans S7.3]|uniref:Uncharacterized protein n=2 Tax=Serpula lacrymans var. lacrymans TaxID=341189 RepID=F8Q4C3_SERL3|nr:uncharacterized protein SERLADRAFT_440585 [Serpula lacrymans var. lacrymans S7.9]EGN96978.1 hypothetical protein SERLA73DRAFT_75821 [Serpula lacrymans var. lacrymans S7.3]EGO22572.1 hypothetical protein SERLADRAFT_440585 [Serpula lacrymans var. lacrymans S7.9]
MRQLEQLYAPVQHSAIEVSAAPLGRGQSPIQGRSPAHSGPVITPRSSTPTSTRSKRTCEAVKPDKSEPKKKPEPKQVKGKKIESDAEHLKTLMEPVLKEDKNERVSKRTLKQAKYIHNMVVEQGKNIITTKEADAQHQAVLLQLAKLQIFCEGNAQHTQITLQENAQCTQLAGEDMQLKRSAHGLEALKIQYQMGITRLMDIPQISPEVSHFLSSSASIDPARGSTLSTSAPFAPDGLDFESNNSAGGSSLLMSAPFVPENLDFGSSSNTVVFGIDDPNSQAIDKYILAFVSGTVRTIYYFLYVLVFKRFPRYTSALGLEVSFAILLLIALTGFLNHHYHFISQIRDWVSLPASQHNG